MMLILCLIFFIYYYFYVIWKCSCRFHLDKVKPIEKKYQLAAHRRNLEDRKFNFYSETAKYFERECDKAKQFNLWNADKLKHTHWENLKKLNALKLRQSKLQELVKNEEKIYEEECKNLERKNTKKELSFEELTNQLKERRAELNLYKPRTFRRIQSYFLYPTQIDRQPLKELNKSLTHSFNNSGNNKNNTTMADSTQEEKHIQEQSESCQQNQKEYQERSDACHQNRVNSEFAQYQHFYDVDEPSEPINVSKFMNEYRDKERQSDNTSQGKRYTPNFLYGHQTYVNDENHPNLDKKYKERNIRQSLQNTNIINSSTFPFDSSNDCDKKQNIDDEIKLSQDTDKSSDKDFDMSKLSLNEVDSVEATINNENISNNGMFSDEQFGDGDYNNDKNGEQLAMELPDNAEVDSDSMLMYLKDSALKAKIQDLGVRESRASMKHQWEELLRLRDMRNRLELFREKQIYQRYDSLIDLKKKEEVLEYIESRGKQLKGRQTVCADSGLYSEEAKRTWNKWVEEDETSSMNNSHILKDTLLKKLEDEWLQLSENDRKVLCQMYNNTTTGSYMQFETQLLAKKGIW